MTIKYSPPKNANTNSLGASARESLLWGGGFTLLRDFAQFGVMLILVRLLSPADYGTAAVAQAIIGFASVLSFGTFSGHALQVRDPDKIDWQAHFTAAVIINTILAVLVLVAAYCLSFSIRYERVALPLAALSIVFVIEIPATLRHRMLESRHDWKRFRILLTIGTLLGMGVGVGIALSGGGVWALIIQIPMFGIPAAVDLLIIEKFKFDCSWSWVRWKETFQFGLDRIGATIVVRGRALNEQTLFTSIYDIATLGIFNRAVGLATLVSGRIGAIAMLSLMPVLTRAEAGSARLTRLGDLVLRGVVWTTIPATALLALTAEDAVNFLYGVRWHDVTTLLPLAAAAIGLGGIIPLLSSLLIANNFSRISMLFEVCVGVSAILMAVFFIPFGAKTYLAGLSVHAIVVTLVACVLLIRYQAISRRGLVAAFIPPIIAVSIAVAATYTLSLHTKVSTSVILRLAANALVFSTVYFLTIRVAFSPQLEELLEVAPGGVGVSRALYIRRTSSI